jgi:predicted MFS family arabinose efflux permease
VDEHPGLPRQDRREPGQGDGGLSQTTTRPPSNGAVALATRAAFLIAGIGTAVWAPLVPEAKLRLGLDDATLGLVLLALGGGAMVAMPLTGLALQRLGGRAVILGCGLLFCLAMPALALAPSVPLLVAALAVFGGALGAVDIAMNAQAVVVERVAGRAMMSGFHGVFSLGGLSGAALMSVLRALGLSPLSCAVVMALGCAAMLASQARGMLPAGADAHGPAFAWPRGRLMLIGALCFVSFLLEGVVLDWSAVFLRFSRHADAAAAGLGYAAFSLTMTFGRLTGDAVVRQFRAVPVLLAGSLLAASGFLLAACTQSVTLALIGFALVGLGAANIVPLLFAAAGRIPGISPGLAMSAAATPGYAGLLAGPALVGLVAGQTGLPMAIAGIGLLTLTVTASARVAAGPPE